MNENKVYNSNINPDRPQIRVPLIKKDHYDMNFFTDLSNYMLLLVNEHGRWPNVLTFTGRLGRELMDIIEKNKWDFSKFEMKYENSPLDKIIVSYSSPINQVEQRNDIINDGLDGKTMDGIPGHDTIKKIQQYSTNVNFSIERKIEPKLEIKLIR